MQRRLRPASTEPKVTAMEQTTRRRFVGTILAATTLPMPSQLVGGGSKNADTEAGGYVRANTDWLAGCRFGIGIPWTAQTVPRNGPAKPFAQAVADFDLKGLTDAVDRSGADYVLFTIAQPTPGSDDLQRRHLPGRNAGARIG
jgi:hypothetical protein